MESPEPLIFSIQHFCLHDGPGIRSLVFFKGCPLRCAWCQNVESWSTEAEIAFKPHLCISCRRCVEKCPEHVIMDAGKRDAKGCRRCFTCVNVCPSGAMTRFGVSRSPEKIVTDLRPEFSLFRSSGGGVTLTGGEPTLYPEFTARLARLLRAEGIDVALETCGLFNKERLLPLLRELNLVLFDIKLYDGDQHRLLCGTDNTVIRENLKFLVDVSRAGEGPPVWPRFPLVPGMTDGKDNISGWACFLKGLGISFLTVIPYHPMGEGKHKWLGLPPGPPVRVPADDELNTIEQLFLAQGIRVYKPGEENFPVT